MQTTSLVNEDMRVLKFKAISCAFQEEIQPIIWCSNDNPGLTLTYFKVKFCNSAFYMGKCYIDGFFVNYCIL